MLMQNLGGQTNSIMVFSEVANRQLIPVKQNKIKISLSSKM